MRLERKISILLALFLIVSYMPSANAYCSDVASAKTVLYADFKSQAAENGLFQGGVIASVDSAYGNSYKMSSPSATAYFYADIDGGRYEATSLSFDVYAETNTARGVLEILDPVANGSTYIANANLHRALYIRQDGLISTFNKFNYGGEGRGCTEKYDGAGWYHFDIWIDYILGNVLCYRDGMLIGELPTDGFKRFGGFRYVFDDMGSGAAHYLDNVRAQNYISRGRVTSGEIQGIPENFKEGIAFLYPRSENPIGFIFDGHNVDLKVTAANGTEKSKKIRVVSELVSESGETEASYKEIIRLSAFETKKINIDLKAACFGYHYVKTRVYDESGSLLHSYEFQISAANMPKALVGNKKVGINGYALTGGNECFGIMDLERKTKLFENAGVGASRFDITQEQHNRSDLVNGEHIIFERNMKYDAREKLIILSKTHKYLPVTDADKAAWKNYVINICERFGDEIDYYQVWNEFNSPVFNKGNNTTEQYVELLKITYETIKEYDPTAKVICNPGANCNAADGYAQDTIDFMKDIFWTYEGYKYMDIMSVHAYVYNDPEVTIKDNGGSPRERFIYELKDWLEEIGHGEFPVMITEMGYSESSEEGEYKHAENFVRYMTLHREDIERIFWYRDINLRFTEDTMGSGWEFQRNLGFVREDNYLASAPYPEYAAKPAFLALCNYNTLMTDAVFKSNVFEDGIYDYEYLTADGDKLNIVWVRNGTNSKTYNTDGKICEVYDLYGNIVQSSEASDSTITVNVSTSPVYVKFVTPEEYEMYMDASEKRLWVKGNITGETDVLSVLYKNTSDGTEIVCVAQEKTNKNGSYSILIPVDEIDCDDNYTLGIGFSNETETIFNTLRANIPIAYLISNNERVMRLSQLKNGDVLRAVFEDNSGEEYNVKLLLASYDKSGRLLAVDERVFSSSEKDRSVACNVSNIENVSAVKLFAWTEDSMIPVTFMYTIK